MTPERLKLAERVFFQALDTPPPMRARFVESACGTDAALRDEVVSLLEQESSLGEFLDRPALGTSLGALAGVVAEGPEDLSGAVVGQYKLTRRLASGGMGTVYLATRADGLHAHPVAVKLIKRGMDSDEIVRRFQDERALLAGLDHPNIARLIDGGATRDGRSFLVMEYVDGSPIDEFCATRRLSVERRLRLYLKVCDAVRYAHAHLVVHRDLKPSNILVTADGTPKLLDFGIAKVLRPEAAELITSTSARPFTPEYASPEQVGGWRITTASDVYALGVVLYELLTGRRPYRFSSRSAPEVERVVATAIPMAPSLACAGEASPGEAPLVEGLVLGEGPAERLRRRLRGDLDTIVLAALRKEPERRYASVERLAADVERHLTGFPVLARKDTLGYRMFKFIARNRAACLAAGAIALTIMGGTAAVAWQAHLASRERDAAYDARDQAEQITEVLQRILESADPAGAGPDAKVVDVIQSAAKRLDSELADQPIVHATVESALGRTYVALGLYEEADRHITRAYERRVALLPRGHHDIAESKIDLAELRFYQNRFDDAERLLRESLAEHVALRGARNEDTSRVWSSLGSVLRARNTLDDAEEAHRTALSIRREIRGEKSLPVAESLNNLANVLRLKGDTSTAIDLLEQSLAIRRDLLKPEHPLLSQSLNNLGVVLERAADRARAQGAAEEGARLAAKAEALMREAVQLSEKSYGPEHPAHATNLKNLGSLLLGLGRYADAEGFLRRAVAIQAMRFEETDQRRMLTQAQLGRCLLRAGKVDEGLPLLEGVLAKAFAQAIPLRGQWLEGAEDLAKALDEAGRSADAKAWRDRLAPATPPKAPAAGNPAPIPPSGTPAAPAPQNAP